MMSVAKPDDPDFLIRLQEWLDGRTTISERTAFEDELDKDPGKAILARKLQLIDAHLNRLNEGVATEEVPKKLLAIVRRSD